jgi:hypothetical protein
VCTEEKGMALFLFRYRGKDPVAVHAVEVTAAHVGMDVLEVSASTVLVEGPWETAMTLKKRDAENWDVFECKDTKPLPEVRYVPPEDFDGFGF